MTNDKKIRVIRMGNLVREIKDFIKDFIKESPTEVPFTLGDKYDLPDNNEYECREFIKNGASKIGEFQFSPKYKYDIYQKIEEGIIYYALIYKKYIMLTYDIEPIQIKNLKGFESLGVIQSRLGDRSSWLNIDKQFVFDYLLKKYDFIISDRTHTRSGKVFWKGMLYSKVNELFCYCYELKENKFIRLTDIDSQFEIFYGKNHSNFRFVISNKKFE